MSLAAGPNIFSSRSFSSPAALLVKVMARMDQGAAGSTWHRRTWRSRSSWVEAPFWAYRWRKARSSAVTQSGTSGQSEPRPYRIRLATRWISTVVLPLPAPASSSSGPSVASAACCCWGFRRIRSRAMAARRAWTN